MAVIWYIETQKQCCILALPEHDTFFETSGLNIQTAPVQSAWILIAMKLGGM
jgi:hypothetical protein